METFTEKCTSGPSYDCIPYMCVSVETASFTSMSNQVGFFRCYPAFFLSRKKVGGEEAAVGGRWRVARQWPLVWATQPRAGTLRWGK